MEASQTLWDVVQFFNKGGEKNSFPDADMNPLGLTETEVDDLANFPGALTSDRFSELRAAGLDRQHAAYLYSQAVQGGKRGGSR
jgi:cytochrome c peroxidase